MTDEHNLVRWSEALAGIARTDLAFTENLYERERYEEVLNVAADIQSHLSGADQRRRRSTNGCVQLGKVYLGM